MKDIIQNLDWMQLLLSIWSVIFLPIITYIGTQIGNYFKAKRIDKYTDILYKNVVDAVKDVYETTVKDMKGTDVWTDEMKNHVKGVAKSKAIKALTNSVYQTLRQANVDFDEYLDGLIGTALYDLKNESKKGL